VKQGWALALGWFLLGAGTVVMVGFAGLLFASGYTAGQSSGCQASLE